MYRLSNCCFKTISNTKSITKFRESLNSTQIIIYCNLHSSTAALKNSQDIRKEFVEYFTCDLDHQFIPSSPVVPWCDPTVSFINSGMNQFKGVFLGYHDPPALKAANYQKCIRVGGKHNDLTDVGHDSYHHTFFEMLGNWSFGDYDKYEACKYAWNALTQVFGINKNHLYVTYFGGDESLGMKADLECREFWQQIGLPDDRIFPAGMKDNFWEMNLTGPCGPCTEIHIDKTLHSSLTAPKMPTDSSNLTELWNIVFIENQRLAEGSIVPLDKRYIDTGMGFERLVAILQGKMSNYDTDLFQPLFETIHKESRAPAYGGKFGTEDEKKIDTGYRILADHARMITVSLADGMVPERNHKLRRIIRKSMLLSNGTFRVNNLLQRLTYNVADSLGDTYPEIKKNFNQIQSILDYEADLLSALRAMTESKWQSLVANKPSLAAISDPFAPGLIRAYEELQSSIRDNPHLTVIPGEMTFKMYDTHGLDIDTIEELAETQGLMLDKIGFDKCMENAKIRSRIGITKSKSIGVSQECLRMLENNSIVKTDDSYKYMYTFEKFRYFFPTVESRIIALTNNGQLVAGNSLIIDNEILKTAEIGVILDKTLFYTPEGGQLSDKGTMMIKSTILNISEAYKQNGYVVHQLTTNNKIDNNNNNDNDNDDVRVELSVGDIIKLRIHAERRTQLMRNHTATHLLNAALRTVFPVIVQRGSVVNYKDLVFKFNTFGEKIMPEHLVKLESLINECINDKVPVNSRTVNMLELLAEKDLTLVPGEVYPDKGLRIVEINGVNIKSKEACCGTHVHNTSMLTKFHIVDLASKSLSSQIIKAVSGPTTKSSGLIKKLTMNSMNYMANINSEEDKRQIIMSFLRSQVTKAINSRTDCFIVYCMDSNDIPVESVPLQLAFDHCINMPVFFIVASKKKIKARCAVPKEYQSDIFNAQLWLEAVAKDVPITIGSFADEDPLFISHSRVLKSSREEVLLLIKNAINSARLFALTNIKNVTNEIDRVSN